MSLDPLFDVVELEAKMPAKTVVGHRIVVTARGPPIDERLRDAHDLGDLLDVEIARREEELELLRLRRRVVSCHCSTLKRGS